MQRVTDILPRGSWSGHAADHITLNADGRHRRRMAMTGDHGLSFLLDLPEAVLLRHGQGLKLEDGRIVEVLASPEPLLEVRGRDGDHLLTLAWHIGNRHLAAQMLGDRILIRHDAVIARMLQGLGAAVAEVLAPFDPEGGAYGGAHEAHEHGHHHHHG
jgi:urease accessory protein